MLADVHVQAVNLVRVLPWVRFARAIGIALAPTQLVIALAAVLVMSIAVVPEPGVVSVPRAVVEAGTGNRVRFINEEIVIREPLNRWQQTAAPLWYLGSTAQRWLLERESLAGVAGKLAIIYFVWTLAGVMLCRSAAVQFCRDVGPSFRQSVQWSLSRSVASLTALLTPLGFALALFILLGICLLPGIVPALGSVWLWCTSPAWSLLGGALAVLLCLLPILWLLVAAAVAVDDSDSFDAFSRSFSLVTSQPWGLLLMGALCGLMAVVVSALLQGVAWQLSVGLSLFTPYFMGIDSAREAMNLGRWWAEQFQLAILTSLFWTHTTLIYLFLRRAVDGTPLDTLAGFDDDTRFHGAFPVVGIPAAPASSDVTTPSPDAPGDA